MKFNVGVISFIFLVGSIAADDVTTRLMYDSMAKVVGENSYPENWYNITYLNINIHYQYIIHSTLRWSERDICFNQISPSLIDTLNLGWQVNHRIKFIKILTSSKILSPGYDKILGNKGISN